MSYKTFLHAVELISGGQQVHWRFLSDFVCSPGPIFKNGNVEKISKGPNQNI